MNILIACEVSGVVNKAFSDRGHNVISCDLEPSDMPGIQHCVGDVEGLVQYFEWDMIIAFPPCTHLAVSGARYFAEKRRDGRQQEAIRFFMEFAEADCPRIAIENPVSIMSTHWRRPDQIIQPWQFGHDASKKTCLWLKGLPKLEPTEVIVKGRYANQTPSGQNKLGPSPDRAKIRATTYQGIADAMAEQWG